MTPAQFREQALANSPLARVWVDDLLLCGLGVAEEGGEVAGIVKKHIFHGKKWDLNHYVEELGDTLWYVDRALTIVSVTLEECLERNAAKTRARYPEGFKKQDEVKRD